MDICSFLKNNNIDFEKVDHPAVFTVEESDKLIGHLPGAKTKNLFLRDKKGRRHFLVVVPGEKRVDLDSLADVLGSSRLSFGSSDRLMSYLRIEPGSVSVLAVINDDDRVVEVFIDRVVWEEGAIQCHPLINTSTLIISCDNMKKFFEITDRTFSLIDVPEK